MERFTVKRNDHEYCGDRNRDLMFFSKTLDCVLWVSVNFIMFGEGTVLRIFFCRDEHLSNVSYDL